MKEMLLLLTYYLMYCILFLMHSWSKIIYRDIEIMNCSAKKEDAYSSYNDKINHKTVCIKFELINDY